MKDILKIKNSTPGFYHDGASIHIQDNRLKFINDVIIYNTQLSNQYRSNEYTLDVLAGRLAIPGDGLLDNEHLTIMTI